MKLPLPSVGRNAKQVYEYRTRQKFSLRGMLRDQVASLLAATVISSGLMLWCISLMPETWQVRFHSPVFTAGILCTICASTGIGIVLLLRSFRSTNTVSTLTYRQSRTILPVKCLLFASFLCSAFLMHEQLDFRQNTKNELQAREDNPEQRPPFDRKEWLPF